MDKTILKYLADDGVTWVPFTGDVPAPSSSIVVKEPISGTGTDFTTSRAYIAGTLQAYVNGLAQSGFVTEVDPLTGEFSLGEAITTGDDLAVYYHVANTAVGNADSLGGFGLTAILQAIYPVGAPFYSGTDELPPLIASIGTWQRLGGVVIVGVDEAQTEFNTVDKTGGAKTHTLTVAQMPSHTHSMSPIRTGSHLTGTDANWNAPSTNSGSIRSTGSAGSGDAHNNLQPYKTKFAWERIA